MGWEKEFRNLQWYGLRSGMSVLEVGSGPGFVTEQLVHSLPGSEVTALEIPFCRKKSSVVSGGSKYHQLKQACSTKPENS